MKKMTFGNKIEPLIYINRGLTDIEIRRIARHLTKQDIRLLVNLRYAPDPIRYDKMLKKELLIELKYPRYD